jgi:hypothetical protein
MSTVLKGINCVLGRVEFTFFTLERVNGQSGANGGCLTDFFRWRRRFRPHGDLFPNSRASIRFALRISV